MDSAAPSLCTICPSLTGYTQSTPGNCNCGAKIAKWTTGYQTPALCSQQCQANAQCVSFGIWTGINQGQCVLFDAVCGSSCPSPTNVGNGWTNDVYNMVSGTLC